MLAIVWREADVERDRTLSAARAQLLATASIVAEQQNDILQEARNVLQVLARLPAVTGQSAAVCRDVLRVVAEDHPRLQTITITDATGQSVCSTGRETSADDSADQPYFRELMRISPPAYAVDPSLRESTADHPVLVVAVPILPAVTNEFPLGIATASMHLDGFASLSQSPLAAHERSFYLIDSTTGIMLAASPASIRTGLRSLAELQAVVRRSSSGGVVDVSGPEGTKELIGVAELTAARDRLFVVVGQSRETILGGANHYLRRNLLEGGSAAVVSALLAYSLAHLGFLRPMNKIVAAIRELGRGAKPGRIAADSIPIAELRVLATAINAMVDEVDARDEDLRGMHLALATSEQHHRELAENVTDMISRLSPEFVRTYVSPSCKGLLGYEPEELVGQAARSIVHVDDWPLLDATLNAPLRSGADESSATYRASRKDGGEIWLESSSRRLPDGSGFVVVTRDISDRKRFETALEEANAQLEIHARQDALTGLANRRSFDETLHVEWERCRRHDSGMSLILADVDLFKSYNDMLGHQAGDDCLRLVGKALASVQCRPGDLVARYGGEEFAVILPNTDVAGATAIGVRMLQAVRNLQLPHPGTPGSIVTVSVGVASSKTLLDDSCSPESLIETADCALYQSKGDGRDRIRVKTDLITSVAPPGGSFLVG